MNTLGYEIDEQIKNLSLRMKAIFFEENAALNYINSQITSENLRLNIAYIIARTLLIAQLPDRSRERFEQSIAAYNSLNNLSISYDDLTKEGWLHEVTGEIYVPSIVSKFLSSMEDQPGDEISPHLKEKWSLLSCLKEAKLTRERKLQIDKDKLQSLLIELKSQVTIDHLLASDVLSEDSETTYVLKKSNDYCEQLGTEIASIVWIEGYGKETDSTAFLTFYRLIRHAGLRIKDLSIFLSGEQTSKIADLSYEVLMNEAYLKKSGDEFKKIWLDSPMFASYITIDTPIPEANFNYNSPLSFMRSIDEHSRSFHDVFDYLPLLNKYYQLLRFIVDEEGRHTPRYHLTLRILEDTERPLLLWLQCDMIERNYPHILPFLLTSRNIATLAFRILDETTVNSIFRGHSPNNVSGYEQDKKIHNEVWMEMFDIFLHYISMGYQRYEEDGQLLNEIMLETASRVFRNRKNIQYALIDHNFMLERYQDAIKRISSKRHSDNHNFGNNLNPRLTFFLIVPMLRAQTNLFNAPTVLHNEFIHLHSGLLDWSIELLRLSNLRVSDDELSQVMQASIREAADSHVQVMYKNQLEYYSADFVNIDNYNRVTEKRRRAKRGVNDFGYEIIDWGYLFLLFERQNLLFKFHESVLASLEFGGDDDNIFSDINAEQYEKLRHFYYALMLAYNTVLKKRNAYELDSLPVSSGLKKMEQWIKELALNYCVDDPLSKRVDIFNERFKDPQNGHYQRPLLELLFSTLNHFSVDTQISFATSFFEQRNDLPGLLTATNWLTSAKMQQMLSAKISEFSIDKFIEDQYSLITIKRVLVDAINSKTHWDLSKPLLQSIENHVQRHRSVDLGLRDLLFEVKLLTSFKEKNRSGIINLTLPDTGQREERLNLQRLKEYYLALHTLYNEDNYGDAISAFGALISQKPDEVKYHFHLFRAETLKAIQ